LKACTMLKKLALAALGAVAVAASPLLTEEEYQTLFTRFVTKYDKTYKHDEFFARYNVFKANFDWIHKFNQQSHSYSVGVNEFTDVTSKEFIKTHNGYKPRAGQIARSRNVATNEEDIGAFPPTVDWRDATLNPRKVVAVNSIQNQEQCGSCWAFSATAAIEGAIATALPSPLPLLKLAEQQLVDCSQAQGNQGCEGGLMDQAFQYVIANDASGGLCLETEYPYTAADGTCQAYTVCKNQKGSGTIASYTDVQTANETALQVAVFQFGPTSVAIEADQQSFQFYSGGIYSDPGCGTNLDHGVVAAGYSVDTSSQQQYWIIRNSWGESWGEQGYMRMLMGSNICGINTEPSYPIH